MLLVLLALPSACTHTSGSQQAGATPQPAASNAAGTAAPVAAPTTALTPPAPPSAILAPAHVAPGNAPRANPPPAGAARANAATSGAAAAKPPPAATSTDGEPRIYALSAAPAVVHNGDRVAWDVRTSDNVSGVSAQVTGFSIALGRLGPGHFGVTFTIPAAAPPFLHRDYSVNVVARTDAGATTSRTISMSFR